MYNRHSFSVLPAHGEGRIHLCFIETSLSSQVSQQGREDPLTEHKGNGAQFAYKHLLSENHPGYTWRQRMEKCLSVSSKLLFFSPGLRKREHTKWWETCSQGLTRALPTLTPSPCPNPSKNGPRKDTVPGHWLELFDKFRSKYKIAL